MFFFFFPKTIHTDTKCSPTNFCGVDLLRLVMLLASRSINAILSEEGCGRESGTNSSSLISPGQSTNKLLCFFFPLFLMFKQFLNLLLELQANERRILCITSLRTKTTFLI